MCEIKGIKKNDKAAEIRRVTMATDIESKFSRQYQHYQGVTNNELELRKLYWVNLNYLS